MRHHFGDGIPGVERWLEGLRWHSGEVVAGDPPDEFFALSREHWADDDLDPPLICASMHDSTEYQLWELSAISHQASGVRSWRARGALRVDT